MKSIRIATLAGAVALAISSASMAQSTAPAGAGARAGAAAGATAAQGTASATPGVAAQAPGTQRTVTSGCANGGNSCAGSQNYQPDSSVGSTAITNGTAGSVTNGNTASGNSTNGTNSNVDPATTRPGSFEPGGAFGTTGTTSGSAGSSTSGAGVTPQQQTDVNGNPNTGVAVVPGTGSVIGDGTTGQGAQQNVIVQQPAAPAAAPRTPLLDEATRKVQARDAQRKATGDSPRVDSVAPRTNRDLTNQMPDDPVIRY